MSVLLSTVMGGNCWADESYFPNPATGGRKQAPLVEIYNAKRVFPGILSGGQPTHEQLKEAKSRGYKTVINLRPVGEARGNAEAQAVRGLGMKYLNIPVTGVGGITIENSELLVSALAAADYPVMVHCASGNRVGALFALDAALRAKLPLEGAIETGKLAGMTRLEGVVRNKIVQEKRLGSAEQQAGSAAVEANGDVLRDCENSGSGPVLAANLSCE